MAKLSLWNLDFYSSFDIYSYYVFFIFVCEFDIIIYEYK